MGSLCYILSNMDISGLVWAPDFWKPSPLGFSQEPSSGPATAMSPPPLQGGSASGEGFSMLVLVFLHKAGSPAAPGSVTSSLLTLIGCLRGTLVSAEWVILFRSSSSSETFSSIKCCENQKRDDSYVARYFDPGWNEGFFSFLEMIQVYQLLALAAVTSFCVPEIFISLDSSNVPSDSLSQVILAPEALQIERIVSPPLPTLNNKILSLHSGQH